MNSAQPADAAGSSIPSPRPWAQPPVYQPPGLPSASEEDDEDAEELNPLDFLKVEEVEVTDNLPNLSAEESVDPLADSVPSSSPVVHLKRSSEDTVAVCAALAELHMSGAFNDVIIYPREGGKRESFVVSCSGVMLAVLSPALGRVLAASERNEAGQYELIAPGLGGGSSAIELLTLLKGLGGLLKELPVGANLVMLVGPELWDFLGHSSIDPEQKEEEEERRGDSSAPIMERTAVSGGLFNSSAVITPVQLGTNSLSVLREDCGGQPWAVTPSATKRAGPTATKRPGPTAAKPSGPTTTKRAGPTAAKRPGPASTKQPGQKTGVKRPRLIAPMPMRPLLNTNGLERKPILGVISFDKPELEPSSGEGSVSSSLSGQTAGTGSNSLPRTPFRYSTVSCH